VGEGGAVVSRRKRNPLGFDPQKPFYAFLEVYVGGSLAPDTGTENPSLTKATLAAIAALKDTPDTLYVIECRCVRKVERGGAVVTDMKKSKP